MRLFCGFRSKTGSRTADNYHICHYSHGTNHRNHHNDNHNYYDNDYHNDDNNNNHYHNSNHYDDCPGNSRASSGNNSCSHYDRSACYRPAGNRSTGAEQQPNGLYYTNREAISL